MVGAGLPGLLAAILAIEAGVPLPVPGDLLLLLLGERAGAGALPVWAAVMALEAVVAVGTAALFFAARGPARTLIARAGPRVGLDAARMARAGSLLERGGGTAIAVGRATPGLRTVTALAAAGSEVGAARAVVLLFAGGSVFAQVHLVLGLALGPAARHALAAAKTATVAVLVALAAVGVAVWLIRRGRRAGTGSALEASCPACLGLGLIAVRRIEGGGARSVHPRTR